MSIRMSTLITATPMGLVGVLSTRSQEQARRNAMVACTALAARRMERLEVEEFVAKHLARHQVSEPAAASADSNLAAPAATPIRHVG